MAKKEKIVTEAPVNEKIEKANDDTAAKQARAAAARAAKEEALAKDTFEYLGENGEKKFAPQANVIIECLKDNGPMSRKALIAKIEEEGKLTTRQPVGRIVTYYQKALCEGKAIQIIAG